MLIIKSQHLKQGEKKLLHTFCRYVMDKFVAPAIQKQSTIIIKFVDPDTMTGADKKEILEFEAWMVYDGCDHGKRHFTVTISNKAIKKHRNAKTVETRMRTSMEYIAHELVHVKQYLNNEIFDYKNGDVRFKGAIYTNWHEGEAYFFSPFEIEAYGYMTGLYMCFKAKLKQEKQEKKTRTRKDERKAK